MMTVPSSRPSLRGSLGDGVTWARGSLGSYHFDPRPPDTILIITYKNIGSLGSHRHFPVPKRDPSDPIPSDPRSEDVENR